MPLSIVLCVLPFEPGILPLETLFDRFGMIPAHVYMASLWFFYLLGIPAAMAGVLNRLSATRGVCLTYFIALGALPCSTRRRMDPIGISAFWSAFPLLWCCAEHTSSATPFAAISEASTPVDPTPPN